MPLAPQCWLDGSSGGPVGHVAVELLPEYPPVPCDEFVSPVVTYRLPVESNPIPPPTWQQLKIWASYSKIRTSEPRISRLVCRSMVKREMRGRLNLEMRR